MKTGNHFPRVHKCLNKMRKPERDFFIVRKCPKCGEPLEKECSYCDEIYIIKGHRCAKKEAVA